MKLPFVYNKVGVYEIKKKKKKQNKTNQSKTFQNMKTPTNIKSMHSYVFFGKCPPFAKEKFQPCPPTTL
jgi:hypothetical protein